MKTKLSAVVLTKNLQKSFQYALSILAGFLIGAPFLLDLSLKWTVTLIISIGFIAILLIVRDTERVLLFTLTFAVPFSIGTGLPALLTRTGPSGRTIDISVQLIDILILALLMFRLARLASRQAEIRFYPFTTVPALAWLVASALSSANARDLGLTAIQLVKMGRMLLLYLVVANSVEDEADVKCLLWALLLGVLCQGLLGSYQAITRQPLGLSFLGEGSDMLPFYMGRTVAYRAYGTIGHGNSYAMYLSATMPFALALLFSEARRFFKSLAGVVLCVGTLGLVFSLSRGGWFSFVVVLIVVLVFAIHRRRLNVHIAWVAGGAILLVLLSLTLGQRDLITNRLTADDFGAAYARITLAKGAVAMIQDHPLFGVGLNNYSLLMPTYDMASYASHHRIVIVHNIFLLIAAETGLVGLATFVWLLATLVIQAWRLASRAPNDTVWVAGIGILSAYIGLSIHGMVDYAMLAVAPLYRLFWLFAAIAAGLSMNAVHERHATNHLKLNANDT